MLVNVPHTVSCKKPCGCPSSSVSKTSPPNISLPNPHFESPQEHRTSPIVSSGCYICRQRVGHVSASVHGACYFQLCIHTVACLHLFSTLWRGLLPIQRARRGVIPSGTARSKTRQHAVVKECWRYRNEGRDVFSRSCRDTSVAHDGSEP